MQEVEDKGDAIEKAKQAAAAAKLNAFEALQADRKYGHSCSQTARVLHQLLCLACAFRSLCVRP